MTPFHPLLLDPTATAVDESKRLYDYEGVLIGASHHLPPISPYHPCKRPRSMTMVAKSSQQTKCAKDVLIYARHSSFFLLRAVSVHHVHSFALNALSYSRIFDQFLLFLSATELIPSGL